MLLVVIINCNRLFYHYVIKNGNTKEEITTFTVKEIIHRIFYQCTMWLSSRVNSPCAQWGKKENRMCTWIILVKCWPRPTCLRWVKKPSLNKEISNAVLLNATWSCTCKQQLDYKAMPSFLRSCHCDFQSGVHGEDLTVIYFFQGHL